MKILKSIMSHIKDFLTGVWGFRITILSWIFLLSLLSLGLYFNLDKKLIAVVLLIMGIFMQAFTGLLAIIGIVPIIGPLVVKLLMMPIFYLLNGIGYIASAIAIKKGHGKVVLNHRIVTVVFLLGVIAGYILAIYTR